MWSAVLFFNEAQERYALNQRRRCSLAGVLSGGEWCRPANGAYLKHPLSLCGFMRRSSMTALRLTNIPNCNFVYTGGRILVQEDFLSLRHYLRTPHVLFRSVYRLTWRDGGSILEPALMIFHKSSFAWMIVIYLNLRYVKKHTNERFVLAFSVNRQACSTRRWFKIEAKKIRLD